MTGPSVASKWRPPLALIVLAVMLLVLSLPVALVIGFRAADDTVSQMGPIEFGGMLAALVVTFIIALVFSRAVTGPINALIRRTEEIARGGRSAIQPLDTYGTREIATLSQSFLDLAGRLVDRTDYVHSFAAHVSHELKSPLTAIKGAAELLRDAEMTPQERSRFLDHIIADSERLDALLGRLRELAKAEAPLEGQPAPLGLVVEAVRLRHARLAILATGELETASALPLEAAVIVFGHLVDNARAHGAGQVTIASECRGSVLVVTVTDDGMGISPGNRDRIFEPFFTTRRESGGTGMGLEIVRTMLAAHGGAIELGESQSGAAFVLTVPIVRGAHLHT